MEREIELAVVWSVVCCALYLLSLQGTRSLLMLFAIVKEVYDKMVPLFFLGLALCVLESVQKEKKAR